MDKSPYILVSPDIENYAETHSSAEPEILVSLTRETHLRTHMPQMLSGHLQGMILRMICRMVQPQQILEIGTFTGYSAICLAEGLPLNGVLHTIEINPEMQEIANTYFEKAGLTEKIIMHTGNALEILPTFPGPFDLTFIDADKENYIAYFNFAYEKTRPGGWIIADNALWYGKVLGSAGGNDRETAGIKAFNDYVQAHPGVENLLLPVRDGLMVARKIL
jgi:caffeoyl-CoA O-methyltransferase